MAKPEIRLKGFNGEWETSPLSTFSKKVTKKNGNLEYRITLTNSAEQGVINQLDFFDHDVSNGDNIRGYYVVEPDDFVYNPRVSVTAPVGPINRNMLSYTGVMSPLYYVFKVQHINKDYLSYFFKTKKWHKYMRDNGNNGARFDRISMPDDVFCLLPISYPKDIKEQQSLVIFFTSLDSMIQGVTKKIASLKQMKQACLVSMFPQAGETTPRVRFKGFKGEWKRSTLGEIFSERLESNIHGEMLSVTMNNGIIKASENGRFDNSNSDKSKYKVVKVNDIAYNSMRMWQGASGCSQYEGIVSPAYTVVVPGDGIDSKFFSYMFKTLSMINLFRLHSQGLTSDTWNLKFPAFSKIRVLYPKDISEQQQIASFFTSLDKQISLQEARLEKLKQIKSACLDKMFV